VTVEVSDAKIRFTIGSVVMTSKLIDGTFPDYQRVIPTGNDKELTVDCQTFARRSTGCRRSRRSAAARSSSPLPTVN
jgi:DNA polymerase III sliding clamp (beta) subunit (PCNA family)